MPQLPLVELVLDELRLLQRQTPGVTIETLALAPVICRLLGSGDPYLAYNRLQHGRFGFRECFWTVKKRSWEVMPWSDTTLSR